MPDVQDLLRNLSAVPGGENTSESTVAADLERGRQAVTRRNRNRFTVTGAFVAVAVAAAVGIGQFGPTVGGQGQGPGSGTNAAAAQLQLVAYTGRQPAGFEVSTVPDGWKVVSSDASSFVVEPPGRGQLPSDTASGSVEGGGVSFEGRIVVGLQSMSRFPEQSPIKKVDVNGRGGELGHPLEAENKLSDTRWLFFPDASGKKVSVQVPGNVGLSDEQVVDFAEGITVTDKAVESVG